MTSPASSALVIVSNFGEVPRSDPRLNSGWAKRALRWRRDPVLCAYETFEKSPTGGKLLIDPEQARILQAISDHDRVAVRTGRGIGKTAAAAILVHWWLSTRYPALVVTSAGTWGHLQDKLWPEIRLWGHEWLLRDAFEYQQMGIYHRDRPEALRAEATSSDKSVNVEGYHSPHLLLLVDEAKGMPDEIWASLLASLTGEGEEGQEVEQKIGALSTPPLSRQGWFARVSSGTEWKVVHVSGIDSPRVSDTYIKEIADTFGETSPEYEAFVKGDIPESVSETVIPLKWFEQCQELAPRKTVKRPVLTCDVAREGDDLTTIGVFDDLSFSLVRFPDRRYGWFSHLAIPETVGRCKQAAKLYPQASAICIDDTGLGGGVTDYLRDAQTKGEFPASISIIAVKFGGKPSQPERFHHRKDELWWAARIACQNHRISLPTDDEIRLWRCPRGSDFKLQMTSALRDYWGDSDQIDVLDKRNPYKKERTASLPTKSPDLAHAFILGIRYYQRQEELPEPPEPPKDQGESLYRRVQEEVKRTIERSSPATNPYRRRR